MLARRLVACLLPGVLCVVPVPSPAATHLRWERVLGTAQAGATQGLATHPSSGRLAVGDERGVLLGTQPEALRRVGHRGPVRDLAFLADGALLVATPDGLFQLDAQGRLSDRTPAPGRAARDVHRILARDGLVAVATSAGPFLSRDGRLWTRLDAGLEAGPALALGLRSSSEGPELWLVVDGQVWRATLSAAPGPPRVERLRRESPLGGPVGRAARDLLVDGPDGEILVLAEDVLAVRSDADPVWKHLRPSLPPGVAAERLGRAAGLLWIATARGLLLAEHPEGPWRRARGAAATASISDLEEHAGRLYAVGDTGLLVAAEDPLGPAREGAGPAAASGPPVVAVHRAVLAYLQLAPEEVRRLRAGVRRRGWLPQVGLHLERDRRRASNHERDETFSAGALRRLQDRDRDHVTDYALGLVLSWELGDTAYHPEEIDVSRETREIIELRDDVLDEVNQLYFERQRVLLELQASGGDLQQAERLRLRAQELAAGLDAWTGGWFGRQLQPPTAIPAAGPGSGDRS